MGHFCSSRDGRHSSTSDQWEVQVGMECNRGCRQNAEGNDKKKHRTGHNSVPRKLYFS
jgi:hypothetical protein